jgi:hypothetical protein
MSRAPVSNSNYSIMSKRIVGLFFVLFVLSGCETRTREVMITTDTASTGATRNSPGPTATPVFGSLKNQDQ